jgi:hypothetical protein
MPFLFPTRRLKNENNEIVSKVRTESGPFDDSETIVCALEDALRTFQATKIDALILRERSSLSLVRFITIRADPPWPA